MYWCDSQRSLLADGDGNRRQRGGFGKETAAGKDNQGERIMGEALTRRRHYGETVWTVIISKGQEETQFPQRQHLSMPLLTACLR